MRVLEQTDERTPERTLLQIVYQQAEQQRGRPVYQGFHQVVRKLLQDGLYGQWIHSYSASEIKWLELQIVAERDQLLSFTQLRQYINEFVTADYYDQRIGLPQERLMLIAMAALQNENEHRLQKVKEAYWALSNGYITLPADVMSFFGKTYHQQQSITQPYSMDLVDSRILSFLSSKVKEKHILVPDNFMEQVSACGSWLVLDKEHVQRVLGCSLPNVNSDTFRQAVAHPSIAHKKVSAIGLMKQLLASKGVIVHFGDRSKLSSTRLHTYIQLPQVKKSTDLARVCSIFIRLLNGIISEWDCSLQVEVAGWETAIVNQNIGLHSQAALYYIEEVSNEINRHLEAASRLHGIQIPLRIASAGKSHSAYPATKQQQSTMIDRATVEQRHTDQGGSITLEKSFVIETAELLQLLMKAWRCGIPEVRLI
ncbi:ribonucleotide reductase N-terminal alpha domain-containing protein [Sporosarcina sp. P13]|uniref:ribonucleotide reductase N-terminal alpha domain-containing protein n=1 Tax=Sporosarcina sp. P13 TaxID=2048263 RepID=UPI00117BA272|nr:ribonucleotide reductase N-terminal alpha domain-containing protein [Sporosarcina sp. P13]